VDPDELFEIRAYVGILVCGSDERLAFLVEGFLCAFGVGVDEADDFEARAKFAVMSPLISGGTGANRGVGRTARA
jgi:hypothetical protein